MPTLVKTDCNAIINTYKPFWVFVKFLCCRHKQGLCRWYSIVFSP